MFQGAIAASEASCRACHAPFAELVTLAGTFINDFNTGGAQTRARARPKVPTEHKAPALRARLGLADGPPGLGRGATPAPHTLVDLGKPAPLTAPGAPFLALGRPEAARTTCPDAGGRSGASWAAWRGRASTARAGASENMEGSTRALEPGSAWHVTRSPPLELDPPGPELPYPDHGHTVSKPEAPPVTSFNRLHHAGLVGSRVAGLLGVLIVRKERERDLGAVELFRAHCDR